MALWRISIKGYKKNYKIYKTKEVNRKLDGRQLKTFDTPYPWSKIK